MTDHGLCECGCGQPTRLAPYSYVKTGWIRGQPVRFIKGHSSRRHPYGSVCSVDGCDRQIEAHGMCHTHFEYQRRTGKTPTLTSKILPFERRFWSQVNKRGPIAPFGLGRCWLWTGPTASAGRYGRMYRHGRTEQAHRVGYELEHGTLGASLDLDHLCRRTLCVNPSHLQPVPHRTNVLRGVSPAAENAAKTHCKNGHEFTPENTIRLRAGGRQCRTCYESTAQREARRLATARYRARQAGR